MQFKNINLKYIIICFTLIVTCLILYFSYYSYIQISKEYVQFEQQFEDSLRGEIRGRVDDVFEQITYRQSQAKIRLKKELEDRVNQAHRIASHIYNKYKDNKTTTEIHEILHDALFPITWDNGHGYYFIMDFDGVMKIHFGSPRLQGQNVINLQDKKGKFLIQEFIEIAKNKEGYSNYYWEKPQGKSQHKSEMFLKYSFIKAVEPLNWLIGAGEYLDNVENVIKSEIEIWIDQMDLKDDNYIFVLDSKGQILINQDKSLVGKKLFDFTDNNGVKLIQNLIKASKTNDNRFVKYLWEKPITHKLAPKISYTRYFPEWDWIVGSGNHLDQQESQLAKQSIILREQVISIFTIFTVVISFIFITVYLLVRNISLEFRFVTNFLKKTKSNDELLDTRKFKIKDFRLLAKTINKMIQARQQKEMRLNTLIENTDDGILIIEDGKFVECNNGTIKMLACKSKERVLNLQPVDFSPKEQADGELSYKKSEEMLAIAIATGSNRFEWLYQRVNGEIFPTEVLLTAIKYDGKDVIFVFLRDITEHTRIINNLVQLNQEKNEFLGIAAHDLKNPLSAIKGYAEEIEEYCGEMSEQEITELAGLSKDASAKMFILITNLLDINQIESGKIRLDLKDTNILPTIKNSIKDYRKKAEEKNIKLHFSYEGDDFNIYIDNNIFSQILDNLISNAVKYSPFDKNIYINLTDHKHHIRCEIKDEGQGLSEADQKKLFGKFNRLSTNPTGGEHSNGLGLFIVKKLAEAINAEVWCESEINKGATFIVEFNKRFP